MKFRHHSKRKLLAPDDVSQAFRLLNIEPLYGYNTPALPEYKIVPGVSDLYYLDDREVDLSEVINKSLPKCPLETFLTTHWLAVEGVQPAIPQNPAPERMPYHLTLYVAHRNIVETEPTVIRKRPAPEEQQAKQPPQVKPRVEHHVSRELQLYYDKVRSLAILW